MVTTRNALRMLIKEDINSQVSNIKVNALLAMSMENTDKSQMVNATWNVIRTRAKLVELVGGTAFSNFEVLEMQSHSTLLTKRD
jgi:hypothetical protein